MKKLNSNDIFNIFSLGDEEVYKEHKIEDIMQDSFVLFGMVGYFVLVCFVLFQIRSGSCDYFGCLVAFFSEIY